MILFIRTPPETYFLSRHCYDFIQRTKKIDSDSVDRRQLRKRPPGGTAEGERIDLEGI